MLKYNPSMKMSLSWDYSARWLCTGETAIIGQSIPYSGAFGQAIFSYNRPAATRTRSDT